jgi:hypothetical protein
MEGRMNACLTVLSLAFLTGVMLPQTSKGQVDMGISIGQEGIQGFYLTVGRYFGKPEREVVVVRERGLPEEEIPVAFFIAERASVAPGVIIDLRLGGMRWIEICGRYRLSPEIFYVPVAVEVQGPPYGKAYGHFKEKPRKQWKTIALADDEIITLVNLRMISEHHRIPAADVIRIHSGGKSFVVVNDDVRKWKKEKGSKEKGKGKGKRK